MDTNYQFYLGLLLLFIKYYDNPNIQVFFFIFFFFWLFVFTIESMVKIYIIYGENRQIKHFKILFLNMKSINPVQTIQRLLNHILVV